MRNNIYLTQPRNDVEYKIEVYEQFPVYFWTTFCILFGIIILLVLIKRK